MKAGHWLLTPSPMVGFFESLIRAIIGKGLYEQYTQRQIARQVYAKTDLFYDQRYAQRPQTHGLPHASMICASPTLCTGSDAINRPPTDLSNPKSASTPLKSRPSSITTLRWSPLLNPVEPALMPEYNIVHNHCPRFTEDLDASDPTIMQSYEYDPFDIGPIGFQAPTTPRRVRAPPWKVTDLESLPPLSSELAAEITRRAKVQEQAGILAGIREAEEKEFEDRRRASRAAQMRVPHLVTHIPTSYSAEDLEAALQSEPPPTPPTRSRHKQLRTQPDQHLRQAGHHIGNAVKQGHVRWAPKPAPQGRRDSTVRDKKSHGGKQSNLRNGSKKL